MAKKTAGEEELIREALERALAEPVPRKLHGTKASPGIFMSSASAAKNAAQRCLELGLLEQRGEQKVRGKAVPLYAIAPAGVAYLLEHDPARQLLAATQAGVENLARLTAEWQQAAAQVRQHVERLGAAVAEAVRRIEAPRPEKWGADIQGRMPTNSPGGTSPGTPAGLPIPAGLREALLEHLREQKRAAPFRPVDLPSLYRIGREKHATLTLGQFHDLLRRWAEERRIRLSPFTQAMYQLPEPECAMIVGREVMYYAEST